MSAAARRNSGIKGISSVRRALRRADDDIRKDVSDTIENLAKETAEIERHMAPRREGDLVQSITYVMSSDKLSAIIAPGIRGATTIKKRAGSYFGTHRASAKTGKELRFSRRTQFDRFQFIKAYWLEVGTKKMRRHPFVRPTYDAIKNKAAVKVEKAVNKAINKMLGRR